MPDVSPLVLDMVVGVHLNMVKCFKASYLAHRKMPQACFFFVSAYFGQFHRPVSFSILTRIAVAAKIAGILASTQYPSLRHNLRGMIHWKGRSLCYKANQYYIMLQHLSKISSPVLRRCLGRLLCGMNFPRSIDEEVEKALSNVQMKTKECIEAEDMKRYLKHTLKHKKDELTLIELGSHLRIDKSLRVQDSDKPKGNNVVGPSVVNMVEHNNSISHSPSAMTTLKFGI
ncbi:hypothetical protein Tco_0970565 [Tanacetum coccineum]